MSVLSKGRITQSGKAGRVKFPGGQGTVHANGTFGSGTLSLEISHDEGVTFTNGGTTVQLKASGVFGFTLPSDNVIIQLDLTGATSPDINFWISANA